MDERFFLEESLESSFLPFAHETVLKVSELVQESKMILEGHFADIWLLGEVSNFTAAASAHWYFSLKDDKAQIRCAMFRGRNQYAPFTPKNGMQIEVKGTLTVYPARGEMQVVVEQLRHAGVGKLHEAFEALKAKLDAEGLFRQERKKQIPRFPRIIGLLTSLQGAVLHDVRTTLARRMPAIPLIVYPIPVQGANAAPAIAKMIAIANERDECDVLLLCRGGGSLEDLWAFNEEVVARAIAASHIPLVSAIGHEVDFTIADLVADLRAPTPTAAAELVCPDKAECLKTLLHSKKRLKRAGMMYLALQMQKKDTLEAKIISPVAMLTQKRVVLRERKGRLQRLSQALLTHKQLSLLGFKKQVKAPDFSRKKEQVAFLKKRMKQTGIHYLREKRHVLLQKKQALLAHDPHLPLQKGYSMVTLEDGTLVHDSVQLTVGGEIHLRFAKGQATAKVDAIEEGQKLSR